MKLKRIIGFTLALSITFSGLNFATAFADDDKADSTAETAITTTVAATVATTAATTTTVAAATTTEATTAAEITTEAATETTTAAAELTTSDSSTEATTTDATETTTIDATETTTIPVRPPLPGVGHLRRSSTPVYNKTSSSDESQGDDSGSTESTPSNNVVVSIGSSEVFVKDKLYEIDSAPYIQAFSKATLVPLRFVALAICGYDVDNALDSENVIWDDETKTATIIANDKVISFTACSDTMIVDGKAMYMDNGVKAEISNGRLYVPFRALGKALGVNVEWDAENKSATYSF